jgi:carbohydrate kinase (thermoresistant glucokinase family)
MGVSGSGKSTIGNMLSEKLNIPFFDGDNFHSTSNKEKMASGIPLSDEDRIPWLKAIQNFAFEKIKSGNLIIACSALKESNRDILKKGFETNVRWIHLHGKFEVIAERMQKRQGHFMPPALLRSQFDSLETTGNALEVSIEDKPEEIILQITNYLKV